MNCYLHVNLDHLKLGFVLRLVLSLIGVLIIFFSGLDWILMRAHFRRPKTTTASCTSVIRKCLKKLNLP